MSTPSDKLQEQPRFRWDLADLAPLLTLAVLIVFFSLTGRSFFYPGTVTQVLEQGAVMGIVAAGLTFVLLCGEIDLSVGNMALWTACLCGVMYELPWVAGKGGDKNVPSVLAVALVILLPLLSAIVLGWLSGVLTVSSRLPSFIITLSMMYIASGLALYLTKSEQFHIPWIIERLGNGGFSLSAKLKIPYSALLAGGIMLLSHLVLQYTRFGRYVYMTGGNREATRLAGVRTSRIVIACLALSAWTAGLGGLVNAGRLGSITLDQNADLLLNAVACVVLGGTSLFGGEGGIPRTIVGVLTLSVLRVGLDKIAWIDNYLRTFLLGVVLLGALVLNGFLARRRRTS
ncbi:MAG: ABC transporter permease [Planctomycetes bacterium]|nr:ABC transporter permease [Planctomycetota bacterium]